MVWSFEYGSFKILYAMDQILLAFLRSLTHISSKIRLQKCAAFDTVNTLFFLINQSNMSNCISISDFYILHLKICCQQFIPITIKCRKYGGIIWRLCVNNLCWISDHSVMMYIMCNLSMKIYLKKLQDKWIGLSTAYTDTCITTR